MSTQRVFLSLILTLSLLAASSTLPALGASGGGLPAVHALAPDDPTPSAAPDEGTKTGTTAGTDPQAAPPLRPAARPLALGDPLFQLDLEASTGDNHLVGIEFDGTYYWVTGGNSFADPNKLYKLDTSGGLVTTYDQPASCTDWGGRDLAYDGSYLYFGCGDGLIHQIDPATGTQVGTIAAPLSPPRGLAYDPATDHFWTVNWDSILYEINRSGTVVGSCPPVGRSTYGLAWDAVSGGGPYLWLWSQDGDPPVMASQLDPDTCALTGVSFIGKDLGGNDTAAGAAISDDVVPGKHVLLGMHQSTVDTLVGYDLGGVYPFRVYLPLVLRNAAP